MAILQPRSLFVASLTARFLVASSIILSASCGGSNGGNSGGTGNSGPYPVGVTVSNLQGGTSLVLLNHNGGDSLTISANGTSKFSQDIPIGGWYSVTVLSQPIGQDCSVADGSGTVVDGSMPNVTVICTALPYTISAKVVGLANVMGLALQDKGDDTLTISSSGLYSFKTQIPSGATYAVTISSQPVGHSCMVQSGSGTVLGSNVTVIVVCPWHVGYALGGAGYYVDQTTGSLTALSGSPFAVGTGQVAIAVGPGTQFLYSVNQGSTSTVDGTIEGFSIDPASGTLSPMANGLLPVGVAPDAIAVDINAKFVYVANSGSNSISAFAVNLSTGTLTAVTGSPFAMTGSPVAIGVDSTGSYVYAYYPEGPPSTTASVSAVIDGFSIDATTGALTPVTGSPFVIAGGPACAPPNYQNPCYAPTAFAIDSTSNLLYVGFNFTCCYTSAQGSYAAESINPSTGALTTATSGWLPQGGTVSSIVIDSAGRFMYVSDPPQDLINGYSIDPASGLLTYTGGNAVDSPGVVAIDPGGQFLYANWLDGSIELTISRTTGVLTQVGFPPATPVAFSSAP